MKQLLQQAQQMLTSERFVLRAGIGATAIIVVVGAVTALSQFGSFFQTADQRGQRLLDTNQPAEAAKAFEDPSRRAMALFDAGEFEESAKVFASLPGPDAAFNHANALVMMGKYEDAVKRYDRAIQLKPDWKEAEENRVIAVGRAARVKQEGGEEGTGGMLGADDIVFNNKPSDRGDDVDVDKENAGKQQDEMLRSIWLRQVQTTPSQFLKMKFAYQQAKQAGGGDTDDGEASP